MAAGGADSSVEKKRRAERAALYRKLVEESVKYPAETIRELAIKQRDVFAARLTAAKDKLGDVFRRWRPYESDLFDAQWQLDEGDKLKASADEKDRQNRRRFYARAYVNLFGAADRLDTELADGSTATVIFREAVETTTETVKKAAEKAAEIVDEVGSGLGDVVQYVGIAATLAALAYAVAKGKR